jgi:murein peptide amidase A
MEQKSLLAKSALQNDIFLHTLGNPNLPKFVLIGGIHGDEPEGAQIVDMVISKAHGVEKNFKACLLAVPRYNPDGLNKLARTNGNGVDLNRNFPSKDWSSVAKSERYFPGVAAESEPETKALVGLLKKSKPFLVVHCHTYSPQICYTGKKSEKWAKILAKDFGHPITEDIGYPTPGSLGQYCLLNLDTPCVCIELPENVEQNLAWKMVGPSLLEIALHGA